MIDNSYLDLLKDLSKERACLSIVCLKLNVS